MKKTEDGNGVIVMKKLTTRGLQALAGGPSRLRSVKGSSVHAAVAAASAPASGPVSGPVSGRASGQPNDSKMRSPVDSMNEVTLTREGAAAPIALATDDEIDQAALMLEELNALPSFDNAGHQDQEQEDDEQETLMATNPMSTPRPAAGLAASKDERVERTAVIQLPIAPPAPPAPKRQMSLRTPPTLIHSQQAIPDEIRQLAIAALEAQKAQPASVGGVSMPASQPAQAKSAVTPAPHKPLPGAPAVVKSGGNVQIVVRETQRRTAFGWTAMLLAAGVFVGLSTVAIVHGDARHAWDAAKNYSSQKRPDAPTAVAAAQPAAITPPIAAPIAPPAASPVAPAIDPAVAAALATPAAAAAAPTPADLRVADNKPAAQPDVKDDAKAAPKPDPKPEVMKPDPAPRPQQKPSNAYASTRIASNDDKPAPAVVKAKPEPKPDVVAAAPKPKPEPVAAKPKPEKDPVAVAPAAKPSKSDQKNDDEVAKISQMAQQQLGAALP